MKHSKFLRPMGIGMIVVMGLAAGATATWRYFSPEVAVKISPYVISLLETQATVPVLVKMKKQVDLTSIERAKLPLNERRQKVYDELRLLALKDQVDLVKSLESRGIVFRRFYISNMVAVWNASADLVRELAARPDVDKIYGNPSIALNLPSSAARLAAGLSVSLSSPRDVIDNIAYTQADQIWAKYGKQGEGIVVAGQDTGVEFDHPALIQQYRGNSSTISHDYHWHDAIHKNTPAGSNRCGYDLSAPCDDGDHGSHTMGTIVGSDGGLNQIGMAPKSQWIACRNMDGGMGTPASYIECFEFFLAPYKYGSNSMLDGVPSMAPHVINNSWGCPESEGCSADEIAPALQAMKAAGIFVVVSAGNDGPGCSTIQDPPAWHSSLTLSVGAYDHRNDRIANFSSRGPSKIDGEIGPDLVAPGVNIKSSVPGKTYAQYGWSGTSMAGPHVAGAVALLWSIRPELIGEIDRTMEILKASAAPKTTTESCGGVDGSQIPNNTFGMGVLDLEKAITLAEGGRPAPQPQPQPQPQPSQPPQEDSGSSWPSIRRATKSN